MYVLGSTFCWGMPGQQLAKFFWLRKIYGGSCFNKQGQISAKSQSILNSSLDDTENDHTASGSLRCIGKQKIFSNKKIGFVL